MALCEVPKELNMALSKFSERAKYGTLKASSRVNRGPLSSGQRSEIGPFFPRLHVADSLELSSAEVEVHGVGKVVGRDGQFPTA